MNIFSKPGRNALAVVVVAGIMGYDGIVLAQNQPQDPPQDQRIDYQAELPPTTVAVPPGKAFFEPPREEDIPDNQFGAMVRLGHQIFVDAQTYAREYVGNGMNCANCHLDQGRKANSAPLWAAYTLYPAYRKKNDHVNTYEERLQGCFRYSMNGTPPPSGSKALTALVTYSYWLAQGAPTGEVLPGRGYPVVAEPAGGYDLARGEKVYQASCAICHGADGQGQKVGESYVFPPLWGPDSYNWGAGMHRINTAAGFIKGNMPLGHGGSLSDQEAWDVAAFMNSHERPQDPRFEGDVNATRERFHQHPGFYGRELNGKILGRDNTDQ